MTPRGIKYVSYGNRSGYASAARRAMLGLIRAGVPLTWTPLVAPWGREGPHTPFEGTSVGDAELDPYCNRRIPYDTVLVHALPDHYAGLAAREPGKRIVGGTVWEMEQIPGKFLDQLASVDLVVVPSEWNRKALLDAGLRVPVAVVPYTLDPTPPAGRFGWPLRGIPDGTYVFYTVNSWEPRKNMEALLRSYLETFTAGEGVCLVIKTALRDMTRFRHGRVWEQLVSRTRDSVPWLVRRIRREYPRAAPVHLLPFETSGARIAALHRRGDCYVSLSHSEGWGLGAFDAAAAGKPVIMTGYGAPREYLPPEHAWLVDCEEVEMPRASYVTYTARWADPDLAQARRLLRYAAEHPDEGRRRGERLAASVRERYDPAVVTELLLRALA